MFKNAKTPNDVTVLLDIVEYISDVKKLSELEKQKENIVKEKIKDCPFMSNIRIKDLSLCPRAQQEDEAFALDPMLLKNIRRGNTIVEV